jgi:hypothetical protein
VCYFDRDGRYTNHDQLAKTYAEGIVYQNAGSIAESFKLCEQSGMMPDLLVIEDIFVRIQDVEHLKKMAVQNGYKIIVTRQTGDEMLKIVGHWRTK